jgi:peptidoglycan/LPS O-acetylase OafA/YrhL
MQRVKKILPLTLIVFFIYAIVRSPTQAADLVHTLWDIIVQAGKGIGGFFDAVLNKK